MTRYYPYHNLRGRHRVPLDVQSAIQGVKENVRSAREPHQYEIGAQLTVNMDGRPVRARIVNHLYQGNQAGYSMEFHDRPGRQTVTQRELVEKVEAYQKVTERADHQKHRHRDTDRGPVAKLKPRTREGNIPTSKSLLPEDLPLGDFFAVSPGVWLPLTTPLLLSRAAIIQ